jgi:hypothetical protein
LFDIGHCISPLRYRRTRKLPGISEWRRHPDEEPLWVQAAAGDAAAI